MSAVHYASYSEARSHFKDLLDAAHDGRAATVRREGDRVAVVAADRLLYALRRLVPGPQAVSEDGGWALLLEQTPVAVDGATFEEAVQEFIQALREYAEDWNDRLRLAPNHADNWGLVQLIDLSSDEQIINWIVGENPESRA
jgi:hypothetical protein